jgi:hypothetical protein
LAGLTGIGSATARENLSPDTIHPLTEPEHGKGKLSGERIYDYFSLVKTSLPNEKLHRIRRWSFAS